MVDKVSSILIDIGCPGISVTFKILASPQSITPVEVGLPLSLVTHGSTREYQFSTKPFYKMLMNDVLYFIEWVIEFPSFIFPEVTVPAPLRQLLHCYVIIHSQEAKQECLTEEMQLMQVNQQDN